jgi:hypothetical protein
MLEFKIKCFKKNHKGRKGWDYYYKKKLIVLTKVVSMEQKNNEKHWASN